MKRLIFSLMMSVFFLATSNAQQTVERTGFDGDNFSLEGALEVFKESYSLRDFERKINTRDRYVNNLDLDYDGRTDYVRVEHKRNGNFHAIILQVAINRHDVQDVAVIEVEKTGRRKAILQIIGDEYLYGSEVIVEPIPRRGDSYRDGYVNVFRWDVVQQILGRRYDPWVSPYHYNYYPTWWSPWYRPTWDIYYPQTIIYRNRCRIVFVHRTYRVRNYYRPYRAYCPIVQRRYNEVHVINGTRGRSAVSVNKKQSRKNTVERQVVKTNTKRTNPVSRKNSVTKVNKKRSTVSTVRKNSTPTVSKQPRTKRATTSKASTRTTTRPSNSRSKTTYGSKSTRPRTSTRSTSKSYSSPSRSTSKRSTTRTQRSTPSHAKTTQSRPRATTSSRPKATRSVKKSAPSSSRKSTRSSVSTRKSSRRN